MRAVVLHRSISYDLDQVEHGVWRFRYVLDGQIRSGELRVSSKTMAVRKTHLLINRELRIRHVTTRHRGISLQF
jgi:hypothetical protein